MARDGGVGGRGVEGGLDDRVEEGGLVVEDAEDRALGDAGRLRDLAGGDRRALLEEQGQGGGDDGRAPLLEGQRRCPSLVPAPASRAEHTLSESSLSHGFPRRMWQGSGMGDVRWMFHATAMGPDYDGILGPLARLFGCRVLHRQQLEEPVGRDGGMTWIGDNSIEIGAPYGEGSSVATFVERLGGGMHSIAVQVDDVPATLVRLEPLGVEVAARIAHDLVFTRPGGPRDW